MWRRVIGTAARASVAAHAQALGFQVRFATINGGYRAGAGRSEGSG